MFDLIVLHVSEPYSRIHLTLVLEILILLWRERAEEFQIGQRVLNTCLALLIWLLTSSSVPPSLLTMLPGGQTSPPRSGLPRGV